MEKGFSMGPSTLLRRALKSGLEGGRKRRVAGRFDKFAGCRALVARQVVHDDDVAGLQFRDQHLPDIGLEPVAVDRAPLFWTGEHHRRDHPGHAQPRDQRGQSLRRSSGQAFFARDPVTLEEPPQRSHPDRGAAFGQPGLHLGKRHVALLGDRAADEPGVRLGLGRSPVTARLARDRPPMTKRPLPPTDRCRHANPEAGRRSAAAQSTLNCRYNPVTQVLRPGSCHPYRPSNLQPVS